MLLGFILGPMMEEFLRRALLLSRGDPTVLVTRPISAGMLARPWPSSPSSCCRPSTGPANRPS